MNFVTCKPTLKEWLKNYLNRKEIIQGILEHQKDVLRVKIWVLQCIFFSSCNIIKYDINYNGEILEESKCLFRTMVK